MRILMVLSSCTKGCVHSWAEIGSLPIFAPLVPLKVPGADFLNKSIFVNIFNIFQQKLFTIFWRVPFTK